MLPGQKAVQLASAYTVPLEAQRRVAQGRIGQVAGGADIVAFGVGNLLENGHHRQKWHDVAAAAAADEEDTTAHRRFFSGSAALV